LARLAKHWFSFARIPVLSSKVRLRSNPDDLQGRSDVQRRTVVPPGLDPEGQRLDCLDHYAAAGVDLTTAELIGAAGLPRPAVGLLGRAGYLVAVLGNVSGFTPPAATTSPPLYFLSQPTGSVVTSGSWGGDGGGGSDAVGFTPQ
jgi:hypothetical protein